MSKINKSLISGYLKDVSGLPEEYCKIFISEYFQGILETTKIQNSFLIKYLGKFNITKTKPRNILNISNKQDFKISSRKILKFTISKKIKKYINES